MDPPRGVHRLAAAVMAAAAFAQGNAIPPPDAEPGIAVLFPVGMVEGQLFAPGAQAGHRFRGGLQAGQAIVDGMRRGQGAGE